MQPMTIKRVSKHSQNMNRRISRISMGLIILMFIVFIKVAYLQVVGAVKFDDVCMEKNQFRMTDRAVRGEIYDRNGVVIATSVKTNNLYVIRHYVKDKSNLASLISSCGAGEYSEIFNRLHSRMTYIPVAYDLSDAAARKLKNLSSKAILVKEENLRYYPEPKKFSNIIGFTGVDNSGLAGIEYQYESILRGKNGFVIYQKKPSGKLYKHPAYTDRPAKQGTEITLTIDERLQEAAYYVLTTYLERFRAKSGSVIIMEVKTGEILAMADAPSYNSNLHGKDSPQQYRNYSVVDMYEPGSVFKLTTAVAALENNLFSFDTPCKDERDKLIINGHTIKDSHKNGSLDFRHAFMLSSNIAFVNIGEKVGKNQLNSVITRMGFNRKTGIEMPGESKGLMLPVEKWIPVHFANLCFGQGILVNSMQIICAYNIIASGGYYIKPTIVKSIAGKEHSRPSKKRVLSQSVCSLMNELLTDVVSEGTGVTASVNGLTIAGKTGTAEKVSSVGGGYEKGKYVASFVGYFPAEDPRYIILTVVDEPKGAYYASEITAPMFSEIVKRMINLPMYRDIINIQMEHTANESGRNNKRA